MLPTCSSTGLDSGQYHARSQRHVPKAGNATSTLFIRGDTGYANYAVTNALVTGIFDRYKSDVIANATARAAPGTGNSLYADYIPVESLPIAGTQSFTSFDYMVPGLFIFAVLLQVTLVAGSLALDVETGVLDRLKLSKARGFDLLSGTFITWTLVIVGQIVLLLVVVTVVFGFHYQGGLVSLGLAVLIGAIAGMAAVSLALLVASFSKNYTQAAALAGLVAVPLGFLCGAFMPLPRQVLGELGWSGLPNIRPPPVDPRRQCPSIRAYLRQWVKPRRRLPDVLAHRLDGHTVYCGGHGVLARTITN